MRRLPLFALLLLSLVWFGNCMGQIGPVLPDETTPTSDGLPQDAAPDQRVAPEPTQPRPEPPAPEPRPEPVLPDLRSEMVQDKAALEPPVSVEPSAEKVPDVVVPEPPMDTTPPDTGPKLVPAFIAQGDIGRTMLSCDDGKTWKANRSWEQEGDQIVCGKKATLECYNTACDFMNKGTCTTKTPCDCDHHPGSPQGMAFGAGWFVGTWGWGPPGVVMRSKDGIKWDVVITGTTFGGIDFGAGTFVTGDRSPRVSTDGGKTWQNGGKADLKDATGTVWNVRRFGFAPVGGPDGRFVVTGESGDKRDILVSADKGKTWVRPTTFDRLCAQSSLGVTGGNGVILILSNKGHLCRSTDAGKTFVLEKLTGTPGSSPIWDGTTFHYWNNAKRFSSKDGKTWTSADTKVVGATRNGVSLGAIAYSSKTGTYVAVNGGWNQWYTKQKLYRSTDGLNWTALGAGDYTASHRIRYIRFGYVKASAKGCQ